MLTSSSGCPECYQDLEEVFNASLSVVNEADVSIQNLTRATSDLTPFDDRVRDYQDEITSLQSEASALIARQTEILVLYTDVLFAINDTLRNRVENINASLDVLMERFTTVYIIVLSSQELMNTTVREFQEALALVSMIETRTVPMLRNLSDTIRSNSAYVGDVARMLESTLSSFSAQVESLQRSTDEILALTNSILSTADQIAAIQQDLIAEVENITQTYSSLDSDLNSIDYTLSSFEMRLLMVNSRIQTKQNSLVEVPDGRNITYLHANASQTESFVRNEVINEIMNQSNRFALLNSTYSTHRLEADAVIQQVSKLGANVSRLLESIQTALDEASSLFDSSQQLINEAEIVAENLESFNNDTFAIGREVTDTLRSIEEVNRNASSALAEAQNLEGTLLNSSDTLRTAKDLALQALNVTNTTLQVS